MNGNGAPLERILEILGKGYAKQVARHPILFISIPVILTLILSTGFVRFHIVRGVHFLYSPSNAPWKHEEEVLKRIWIENDHRFYPGKDVLFRNGIYFLITTKDKSNVLAQNPSTEVIYLLDVISNSTFFSITGKTYHYSNICLKFQNQCFQNTQVKVLAEIFQKGDQFLTEPVDLTSALGGVILDENGLLKEAKAWLLVFHLKQGTEELRNFASFSITFIILVVFSVICTFNLLESERGMCIDWRRSKPLMGVMGVVSTLMAITSAIGLLLWFDVTFVEMCSVMPFLSLTIGIDDSFLMLASWHATAPTSEVIDRMTVTMRHAAASITITSLTDMFAFLIGSIAPLPAVKYFCYYSCVAILFIYLYTLTIFSAFLAIQGNWEKEYRNCLFYCKVKSNNEKVGFWTKHWNCGSLINETVGNEKRLWYERFFGLQYAQLLNKRSTQLMALLSYLLYAFFAFNGLQNLKTGFDDFHQALSSFTMASDKYDYDIIENLKTFRFTVSFKQFEDDIHISECAHLIRSVCNQHPAYNLSTYSSLWNLADQLDTMWPQTSQDLYISVGVMVLVSLLFIPDIKSGFVVGCSILSVGYGVLGFMNYWNVKLDATSMITVAMSVGFSVDFSAHVTFAFCESGRDDKTLPDQRLSKALTAVGWPICQGTLSVLLGVIVLGTIDSYIVQTCFKTVFLVISFGIVHALFYIPILLDLLYKLENAVKALEHMHIMKIKTVE